MMRFLPRLWLLGGVVLGLLPCTGRGADKGAPPTGFFPEVRVENATRLDWEFAASAFGAAATKLPAGYDSLKQRYQLYVPDSYDPAKAWPLVVFISPGDDPLGWRYWESPCADAGMLFCAAYGAGNNCPAGQRTRIVLDMLDDVRRHYRIDADQTYLSGFSGGGRMACTIGFALPEYFGGVVPICGTNPLNRLDYLVQRVHDRLSVAFVTGSGDFNRAENEDYMMPLFQDLGIRERLWVVPKLGHGVPGPQVLTAVSDWLAEDLKRRQADARAHPGLAVTPDEVLTPGQQAARLLETAEAELKHPESTWRGAAMLRGVVARWGKTEAADRARRLLDDILMDAKKSMLLAEQGGAEERRMLMAQGRGLERLGEQRQALQAYQLVAKNYPDTQEGQKAAGEAKRLAALPYLGIGFAAEGARVGAVVAKGPADRAGLKPGDVLVQVGTDKVASPQEVRRALQAYKAGEKVNVEVQRGGKTLTVEVELGSLAEAQD
jgi:PDZ domain